MHYASNNASRKHLGIYHINYDQRVLVSFVKQYNVDELLMEKLQATFHFFI